MSSYCEISLWNRKKFQIPLTIITYIVKRKTDDVSQKPDKFICIHLILCKFHVLYEDFKIALD